MSDNSNYIHEIHSVQEYSGELYLSHETGTTIINIEGLYDSLPYIIEKCIESENLRHNRILKDIKKASKKI